LSCDYKVRKQITCPKWQVEEAWHTMYCTAHTIMGIWWANWYVLYGFRLELFEFWAIRFISQQPWIFFVRNRDLTWVVLFPDGVNILDTWQNPPPCTCGKSVWNFYRYIEEKSLLGRLCLTYCSCEPTCPRSALRLKDLCRFKEICDVPVLENLKISTFKHPELWKSGL